MDMHQGNSEDAAMEVVAPWAAAFGNHVILDNILSHLSTPNLRSVQLVNKFWNAVASSVIRKEHRLKVRFSYKTSTDFIRACAVTEANLATIYELEFGDIVSLQLPDIADCKASVEALNSLLAEDTTGKLAVGIALKIHSGFRFETEIQRIFSFFETVLCRVRNLVILTLDLTQYVNDALKSDHGHKFQNLYLPHLEQVTFVLRKSPARTPYKPICKLIMNAAPNLKVIKGASISSIWDAILECGKAPCVKSYTVEQNGYIKSDTDIMLQNVDSLIEHTPALELLRLDDYLFTRHNILIERETLEVWTAVRRLVLHYRKSLRSIRTAQLAFLDYVIGPEENYEEFPFPVFKNLEFLNLSTTRVHQLLPSLSLDTNQFPCLTRVKLELSELTGDCLRQYFPTGSTDDVQHWSLPTVRKLELSDRYDKKGMEILCQVFPNVKEIKFYQVIGLSYTHSLQNGLWNMPPSVEWLTLHFTAVNYKKKLGNLDELFTGIRKQTLAKLPRDRVKDAYLTIASRNGIRKLKALKRLRIIFDMNESQVASTLDPFGGGKVTLTANSLRENMEFPFFIKKGTFTALSSLYAFSSPDFETYIYYDIRAHCVPQIERMIQELLPNVIPAPSHMSRLSPSLKDGIAIMVRRLGVSLEPFRTNEPASVDVVPSGSGSANAAADNETDDSMEYD